MAIAHSEALNVLEQHFQSLEPQEIDAKILDRQLYARPLNCAQWNELKKLEGMDYNIRLVQMAVVYEDGTQILTPADIYRLESRVDGSVITALSNMAFAKIISGVTDLKNGLRRPEEKTSSSATRSPSA